MKHDSPHDQANEGTIVCVDRVKDIGGKLANLAHNTLPPIFAFTYPANCAEQFQCTLSDVLILRSTRAGTPKVFSNNPQILPEVAYSPWTQPAAAKQLLILDSVVVKQCVPAVTSAVAADTAAGTRVVEARSDEKSTAESSAIDAS